MAKLNLKILNKAKKKEIIKELSANYGIKKLNYIIVKWGKRLRIFSGNISKDMLLTLTKKFNVDSIGLQFASLEGGLRMGIDAVHLLSKQITHGEIEINDKQALEWFKGENIELDNEQKKGIEKLQNKFIILKNKNDIIGIGKISQQGITNFMPKERRIKQ